MRIPAYPYDTSTITTLYYGLIFYAHNNSLCQGHSLVCCTTSCYWHTLTCHSPPLHFTTSCLPLCSPSIPLLYCVLYHFCTGILMPPSTYLPFSKPSWCSSLCISNLPVLHFGSSHPFHRSTPGFFPPPAHLLPPPSPCATSSNLVRIISGRTLIRALPTPAFSCLPTAIKRLRTSYAEPPHSLTWAYRVTCDAAAFRSCLTAVLLFRVCALACVNYPRTFVATAADAGACWTPRGRTTTTPLMLACAKTLVFRHFMTRQAPATRHDSTLSAC